jgi:hypothetical protein
LEENGWKLIPSWQVKYTSLTKTNITCFLSYVEIREEKEDFKIKEGLLGM